MIASSPFTLRLHDGEIAGLHYANPGRPRLLFAHGNGFCAAAYAPLFHALGRQFDIIAIDLRGHGNARLPADPDRLTSWSVYARDIKAVIANLDRVPNLLSGHSLGGTSTLIAGQSLHPALPIAVIDPVVLPLAVYWAFKTPLRGLIRRQIGLAERARRRTHAWPDREIALQHFKSRKPYDDWVSEALAGYVRDGLRDSAGGVELACSPDWEAANFEAQPLNPFSKLKTIGVTTRVLKAERDSTVWNGVGLRVCGVHVDTLKDVAHLAPMTHPNEVASWIRSAARKLGVTD